MSIGSGDNRWETVQKASQLCQASCVLTRMRLSVGSWNPWFLFGFSSPVIAHLSRMTSRKGLATEMNGISVHSASVPYRPLVEGRREEVLSGLLAAVVLGVLFLPPASCVLKKVMCRRNGDQPWGLGPSSSVVELNQLPTHLLIRGVPLLTELLLVLGVSPPPHPPLKCHPSQMFVSIISLLSTEGLVTEEIKGDLLNVNFSLGFLNKHLLTSWASSGGFRM